MGAVHPLDGVGDLFENEGFLGGGVFGVVELGIEVDWRSMGLPVWLSGVCEYEFRACNVLSKMLCNYPSLF